MEFKPRGGLSLHVVSDFRLKWICPGLLAVWQPHSRMQWKYFVVCPCIKLTVTMINYNDFGM